MQTKHKLTDRQLKHWAGRGKPLSAQSDGDGLYFRIHDSGVAQFYFRYRFGGKGRWLFLGNYPDLGLQEARGMAREARLALDKGVDPAAEKQRRIAVEQASRIFRDVAQDWYDREIKKRYAHPLPVWRCIENHLLPKLGGVPIKNITAGMVDNVLQKVVNDGAPTAANDALRHAKRIFAFARKRHLVESNPVADFELTDAGGHEMGRTRALSEAELATLFRAMPADPSFGRDNELAVKLLLMLCVRKGELLTARWEDFDLDHAVWTQKKSKTGSSIRIPLPAATVEMLKELKVRAAGSDYVFPVRRLHRGREARHSNTSTINLALKKVSQGMEPFTVHDLRRTARTHLAALGVPAEVAERCLNHKLRGIEGIYNRHDYFDQRKTALEQWAELLLSMERNGTEKVVPIKRAKRASVSKTPA